MRKKFSFVVILLLILCFFCEDHFTVYAQTEQNKNAIEAIRKNTVWFGDSRTVYLGRAVYGYKISKNKYIYNHRIVARRSVQYNWANGTGYKLLKKYMDKYPEKTIIMCHLLILMDYIIRRLLIDKLKSTL